jgi:hypothetical protein
VTDNLVTFPAKCSARGGKQARVPGVRSSRRLWIRLTPDEREDLDQVAAENHTCVTDVIRLAVNSFVSDYKDGEVVFPAVTKLPRHNHAAA